MSTGKKNRYSSVEKLWKLDDKSLKTPKHDEMIMFLLEEDNVRKLIPFVDRFLDENKPIMKSINKQNYFYRTVENFWQKLEQKVMLSDKDLENYALVMIKDNNGEDLHETTVKVELKILENIRETRNVPNNIMTKIADESGLSFKHMDEIIIKDERAYGLFTHPGYRTIRVAYLTVEDIKFKWQKMIEHYHEEILKIERPWITIRSEVPIMTSKDFLVGYWDIVIQLTAEVVDRRESPFLFYIEHKDDYFYTIYIEVKPKIDSFGATLRQIRTYQQYCRKSVKNTCLFTDDLRFKKQFEGQGIIVVSRQLIGLTQFVKDIVKVSKEVTDEELRFHLDKQGYDFDVKEIEKLCDLKRTKDGKLTLNNE